MHASSSSHACMHASIHPCIHPCIHASMHPCFHGAFLGGSWAAVGGLLGRSWGLLGRSWGLTGLEVPKSQGLGCGGFSPGARVWRGGGECCRPVAADGGGLRWIGVLNWKERKKDCRLGGSQEPGSGKLEAGWLARAGKLAGSLKMEELMLVVIPHARRQDGSADS